MKYCDDCKWCSCNFEPNKEEKKKYRLPRMEKKNPILYTCMHKEAAKSARFDCNYCGIMRLDHNACKKEALLFNDVSEEK